MYRSSPSLIKVKIQFRFSRNFHPLVQCTKNNHIYLFYYFISRMMSTINPQPAIENILKQWWWCVEEVACLECVHCSALVMFRKQFIYLFATIICLNKKILFRIWSSKSYSSIKTSVTFTWGKICFMRYVMYC